MEYPGTMTNNSSLWFVIIVMCMVTCFNVNNISLLVNFYLQIQNPINLISMSTTCLESFGADLSENKLYQCVSILLTGTSTIACL